MLLLGFAAAGVAKAEAARESGALMPLRERAAPPRGYVEYCLRNPEDCPRPAVETRGMSAASAYWQGVFSAVEPGAITAARAPAKAAFGNILARREPLERQSLLTLSPTVWDDLNRVNRAVNSAALPISDQNLYGRSDYWSLPVRIGDRLQGDCEDFVLEKKRRLTSLGYPANVLSVALVRTASGENHAVLVVGTNRGDFVLDSLSDRISPWSRAHYTLLLRQSPEGDNLWARPAAGEAMAPRL